MKNLKSNVLQQTFTAAVALAALILLAGCQNTRDYSVRSFQGPMPMADQVFADSQ